MEERTTGDGDPKSKSLSTDEYEITIPETDETNEDLIGLSEEEYEKRRREEEHLKEECEKMIAEGKRLVGKGEYRAAETFYRQALACCPEEVRAKEGVLVSLTEDFRDMGPLFEDENAELVVSDPETRKFVLKAAGDRLKEERARIREEIKPLKERFRKAQTERREPFRINRNYYLIRFMLISVCFLLLGVGCGVSGYFIPRRQDSLALILTIAFGALALFIFLLWLLSMRKLVVAQRLCRENERLSSTEEGARIEELEEKLANIVLILAEE